MLPHSGNHDDVDIHRPPLSVSELIASDSNMTTVASADTVDISSPASKQSASTGVVQRQQRTAAEVVVNAVQTGNL